MKKVVFRMVFALVACAAVLGVTGCAGSYRSITSVQTGCLEHEVRIHHASYGYNRFWNADCRGRSYHCRCERSRCQCLPAHRFETRPQGPGHNDGNRGHGNQRPGHGRPGHHDGPGDSEGNGHGGGHGGGHDGPGGEGHNGHGGQGGNGGHGPGGDGGNPHDGDGHGGHGHH